MLEPRVLGLQLQRRIIATADFQDETPLVAVDAEVEILLAAKRLQLPAQPVMPFQQLKRLLPQTLAGWANWRDESTWRAAYNDP